MGISVPTPIQRLAIGPVLAGKDVIAKAETGTGKTLAFGAPMMGRIDPSRSTVLGLVLCPTRELAQQVCGVLEQLGAARGVKVALVVGGEPLHPQVQALQRGAQVVVGTPGRVLDLYGQRFLSFPWTEYVVLDEADEMLEIGFLDDVRKILSYTPEERQTLLFSATFPDEVLSLARESTREPVEVATAAGVKTVDTIEQSFIEVEDEGRPLTLIRLIETSDVDDVFLVFCARRTEVDALMRRLERLPFPVKALHGGFDQPSRFRVMSAFRSGEVKALVATDVASRGLDVAHVSHVINYTSPHDLEEYTHRIGRTGRAGRSGIAITLVGPKDLRRWRAIVERATWKISLREPPGRSGLARTAHEEHSGRSARPARGEERRRHGPGHPAEREREGKHPAAAHPAPRTHAHRAPAHGPGHPAEREGKHPAAAHSAPHTHAHRAPAHGPGRERRPLSTRERLAQERAASPEDQGAGQAQRPHAAHAQRAHGHPRSETERPPPHSPERPPRRRRRGRGRPHAGGGA